MCFPLASIFNPDPVWVCDVCQIKLDEFKIMEVGCFSCAGLYNRNVVVDAVSAAVLKEWQSYQLESEDELLV